MKKTASLKYDYNSKVNICEENRVAVTIEKKDKTSVFMYYTVAFSSYALHCSLYTYTSVWKLNAE